jgi:hypothetical protein
MWLSPSWQATGLSATQVFQQLMESKRSLLQSDYRLLLLPIFSQTNSIKAIVTLEGFHIT